MRTQFVAAALLLSLLFSLNTFSSSGIATVTGTVSHTGARSAGATLRATVVDIAVVTTTLSNKA